MMTLSQLSDAMNKCEQTEGVSVMQHGIMVHDAYQKIIEGVKTGVFPDQWRVPEWIGELVPHLMDYDMIRQYHIFHDCGKPFCLSYDERGRKHFPNHANISADLASNVPELKHVESLIRMDMDIHILKNDDIQEFAGRKEWATLIMTGFAEVHANAEMFGGLDSDSFKIKAKHLFKKGQRVLEHNKGSK